MLYRLVPALVGLMGFIVRNYYRVYQTLQIFSNEMAKRSASERSSTEKTVRAAQKLAMKFIFSTLFFLGGWVPAVCYVVLQILRAPIADRPWLDIVGALGATMVSCFSQFLNFLMFSQLRDALRNELKTLRPRKKKLVKPASVLAFTGESLVSAASGQDVPTAPVLSEAEPMGEQYYG